MEYVAGKNLKNRLGRPASLALALDVVSAVGSALDYAHSKGVVHRDVKPANILFTEDNRIVLSDFGIVRLADDDSSLTRGVIGTPQYMAPEQALGREVDGRSDLYSLGVVLFEMLTGRVPFKGDAPLATLSMHATLPPPSTRERNPDLTEAVDAVAMKALAKSPDERFQSGQELRAALAAAVTAPERPDDATMLVTSMTMSPTSLTPVPAPADLESLYRQLLDLVRRRDWGATVNIAAQILGVDPNYRDVSAILASAGNELRFTRGSPPAGSESEALVAQAKVAMDAGRLMEAATILQQVLRGSPHDAAARAQLEEVNARLAGEERRRRRAGRLDQLYALAQSKSQAGDWHWANHILQEIVALDPRYRDAEQLLSQVRAHMRAQGMHAPAGEIASLQDQADLAMAEERWADAEHRWAQILHVDPDLAAAREQLETARRNGAVSALNAEAARLAADGQWQEAIQKLEEIKALTGR